MGDILRQCRRTPADRDPEITLVRPFTSVAHRREWGILYIADDGQEKALIFYWIDASGEERQSVRWFVHSNVKYRLRFSTAPAEPSSGGRAPDAGAVRQPGNAENR